MLPTDPIEKGILWQRQLFLREICRLLADDNLERIVYEVKGQNLFEDFAVYHKQGKNVADSTKQRVEYYQAKYHISNARAITADDFTSPVFLGTQQSLLQRLLDDYRRTKETQVSTFIFCTNWDVAKRETGSTITYPLGEYIGDNDEILILKLKKTPIWDQWIKHLQETVAPKPGEEEIEAAVSTFRFQYEEPRRRLRNKLNHTLSSLGLKPDYDKFSDTYDKALAVYLEEGYHEMTSEQFITLMTALDLWVDAASKLRHLKPNTPSDVVLSQQTTGRVSDSQAPLTIGVVRRPDAFVGRDNELAFLKEKLGVSAIASPGSSLTLALTGMPGVGKTSLVAALANELDVRNYFSGGILWASMGQQNDAESVLNDWADMLGISLQDKIGVDSKVIAMQARLPNAPTLIILDDVWLETSKDAVVLRRAGLPSTSYLITTRDERVARVLAPNEVIKVDVLSEKAAVSLIARYSNTAVVVAYERVRQLAHAVGNLPLALSLVGGYLATHIAFDDEVDDVLEALKQTELWLGLTDAEHTIPLSEVIGRSVDALDEHSANFIELAAFAAKPAAFSRDAAAWVADADKSEVSRFVLANLLEKVDEKRVRMHQATSAVAASRAVGEIFDKGSERHARYYLDLVDQDTNDWQTIAEEWLQILHAWDWLAGRGDHEDILLAYVNDLRSFQARRRLFREEISWDERAVKAAKALNRDREVPSIINNKAIAHQSLGEINQAISGYEQAIEGHRKNGNAKELATSLDNLATLYALSGSDHDDKARELFDEAMAIYEDLAAKGDTRAANEGKAAVYEHIGGWCLRFNELGRAFDSLKQSFDLYNTIPDPPSCARVLSAISTIYRKQGDLKRAKEVGEQALEIHREVGDQTAIGMTMFNLGALPIASEEWQVAQAHFKDVLAFAEESGNEDLIIRTKRTLVYIKDKLEK